MGATNPHNIAHSNIFFNNSLAFVVARLPLMRHARTSVLKPQECYSVGPVSLLLLLTYHEK